MTETIEQMAKRMCESCHYTHCADCPLPEGVCVYAHRERLTLDEANRQIGFIRQWAQEHPLPRVPTYKDKLREAFPKASVTNGIGSSRVCRDAVFGLKSKGWFCSYPYHDCEKCWNELYPEEESKGDN